MTWRFITEAFDETLSAEQLALLAAGPLEDLINDHGPEFMDRIDEAARQQKVMRLLLAGVWRGSAKRGSPKAAAWDRFDALRSRLGIVPN